MMTKAMTGGLYASARALLPLSFAAALTLSAGQVAAQPASEKSDAAVVEETLDTRTPSRADPWEGTNRKIFVVSAGIDKYAVRPGAVFYHHATPTPVRHGLHNALGNLRGPIIFINDVLQMRPKAAGATFARFVVNSTVGLGGFVDVAGDSGIAFHDADFGQTLGRYGVKPGPYIYLPVFGPSTVRDLVGRGVDTVADPVNSVNYSSRDVLVAVSTVVGAVDARDQVDPLLKSINATSTDPYATQRSLYLQNRASMIRGKVSSRANLQALPDFGDDAKSPKSRSTNPKP